MILNTSDGLHSAHFVQLRVKDFSSGVCVGVVNVPIADFFSHDMVKGEESLINRLHELF